MSVLQLSESVLVRRPVADLFGYVADVRRAHEWRTEVRSSTMSPAGPMRAGSRLREVSVIAGRRLVTEFLVEMCEEPHRITFRHRSGALPMHGAYEVSATGDGALLRYDLTVELTGRWALMAPVFRISWPQRMTASLDELRYRLESAPVGSTLSLAS